MVEMIDHMLAWWIQDIFVSWQYIFNVKLSISIACKVGRGIIVPKDEGMAAIPEKLLLII